MAHDPGMAKASKDLPVSVEPRLRVSRGRRAVFGPGRVELLERIGETGSLRAAAAQMEMSYLRAWKHVKSLNGLFPSPVVVATRGGKAGGGAVLTDVGRQVVACYRHMEGRCDRVTQSGARTLQRLLTR